LFKWVVLVPLAVGGFIFRDGTYWTDDRMCTFTLVSNVFVWTRRSALSRRRREKPFFFFQLDIHRQLRGGGWKKRDGAKQHLQPHTADNQKEEEEHTSRN
jgi:hypothetical protein